MKAIFSKAGLLMLVLALSSMMLVSCGKSDNKNSAADKELLGAGATFPFPLYSKMFDEYNKLKSVKVNYQSIGSGGGIEQLKSKTVDFGASDKFLNDDELSKMPAPVLHIPTCLGAIAVTFNLPGVTALKLNPEVLSAIYLGTMKKWDDEKIKALNPDAKLPNTDITVVHRSDGSGTTAGFTDYLSKISDEWKSKVGSSTSVNWPAGLGGKGNEGVSGTVKQTPGAIGYVELIYALQNNMPMASLQNKKGNFIMPSLASTSAAANTTIPDDCRVSLTNSDADQGYPIVSFTYILLYKDQNYNNRTDGKVNEVLKLVWWMTHDGQKFAEPLSYAALPPGVVKQDEAILKAIVFGDKPALQQDK